MTTRTVSLLLLSVLGLVLSAVLLALMVPAVVGLDLATPWLAAPVALLAMTGTLFAGRRFILPAPIAAAPARAAVTLLLMVGVAMGAAGLLLWAAQTTTGVSIPGAVSVALWFGGLWLGVASLHRARPGARLRMP